MKRCSKCGRTYDESLTFCLEDGTVLSAPYEPQAILGNTPRQTAEPPPTEILSSQPSDKPAAKSNQPLFLYASIAFAIVVLLIVGIAWIKWSTTNSNTRSTSESSGTSSSTPATPQASSSASQIDISGAWRDGFGNTSQITQTGETFRFSGQGTACRGQYVSSATGTLRGDRIDMMYESNYSRGQCQGTVSPNGRRVTLTCVDSACGQFLSVSERVGQ